MVSVAPLPDPLPQRNSSPQRSRRELRNTVCSSVGAAAGWEWRLAGNSSSHKGGDGGDGLGAALRARRRDDTMTTMGVAGICQRATCVDGVDGNVVFIDVVRSLF